MDKINFEIEEGEFVFLIGPSGSGKTTIIRHLIREENPTEGRIYFDDDDITRYKRNKVYELRRKIGVIFQDYKLINDKNAFENIAFAMEAAGQSAKDIKETVPYVLDIVGLANRWNAFPAQLSGGEKQRVAIARSLANNPKLLIADEPTGNLDPEAAWDIVQILSKINNWGTTVIMSTHGSDIVDTLGKRVLSLKDGKVVKDVLKGTYKDDKAEILKIKLKENETDSDQQQDANSQSVESGKKDEEDQKKLSSDTKSNSSKRTRDQKNKKYRKEFVADEEQDNTDQGNRENPPETKKPKKKKAKDEKSEKDNKEVVVKDTKETKDTKESEVKVSLTDRQKSKEVEEGISKDTFESLMQKQIEKEEKRSKFEKKKKSNSIGDIGFSPKLVSILKAFGYDSVDSLKKAGYKKISKIDELSPKDLKRLKEVID